MKVLFFESAGWCEELKISYPQGRYLPKSKEEYEALKNFASNPVEIKQQVTVDVEEYNRLKSENAELVEKVKSLEEQLQENSSARKSADNSKKKK